MAAIKGFDSYKAYEDTMSFVNGIVKDFSVYPEVMEMLRNGDAETELRERVMLRAIDEAWVTAVEDALPALDTLIRNPSKFIDEKEEVLPIELTRNISSRSIQHLSQHTDFISRIDGDQITPSKILNVFREETLQTYENKFVNTLLNRLYTFVNRRYMKAKEDGADTKSTGFSFAEKFEHNGIKGKMNFHIELEEPATGADVEKNYVYTTDLWKRVEKLNSICTSYMDSSFVQEMGKSYIRPPVMRTNAILKNKNLNQCLALWQFIESYENTGCTMLLDEKLLDVDKGFIRDIYSTMALEYLLFRYRLDKGFDGDGLDHAEGEYKPRIVDELVPADSAEFDAHYSRREPLPSSVRELTETDLQIIAAVDEAITADEVIRKRAEALEILSSDEYRLRRSFAAKFNRAGEEVQSRYTDIKNLLLSFDKVKSRESWSKETFYRGKTKLAVFTMRGKSLTLNLALDPKEFDKNKYHFTDASATKLADVPLTLPVKSNRALKYALELVYIMTSQMALLQGKIPENDYRERPLTTEILVSRGLIKVIKEDPEKEAEKAAAAEAKAKAEAEAAEKAAAIAAEEEAKRLEMLRVLGESGNLLKRSFTAKYILAGIGVQSYYSDIKNDLLSYRKIKAKTSWNYETYTNGRKKCAILTMRGKTLTLYLALDPNAYDAKRYHFKDVSSVPRYSEVALCMPIRSDRALKYAKALIADMMSEMKLEREETAAIDYRVGLLSEDALIEQGLIKRPAKAVEEEPKPLEITEEIPVTVEETTEESPVIEEPVIEETVEEAPVIEEPVIEEPVIEESVIENIPEDTISEEAQTEEIKEQTEETTETEEIKEETEETEAKEDIEEIKEEKEPEAEQKPVKKQGRIMNWFKNIGKHKN